MRRFSSLVLVMIVSMVLTASLAGCLGLAGHSGNPPASPAEPAAKVTAAKAELNAVLESMRERIASAQVAQPEKAGAIEAAAGPLLAEAEEQAAAYAATAVQGGQTGWRWSYVWPIVAKLAAVVLPAAIEAVVGGAS